MCFGICEYENRFGECDRPLGAVCPESFRAEDKQYAVNAYIESCVDEENEQRIENEGRN